MLILTVRRIYMLILTVRRIYTLTFGAERVNDYGTNLSNIAPNQTLIITIIIVILTSQLTSFREL